MVRHILAWMAWHSVTSTLTSFIFYQDSGNPRSVGFLKTLLLLGIIIRTTKLLGIKVLVLL